jgi:spoIIIJ-associated protein
MDKKIEAIKSIIQDLLNHLEVKATFSVFKGEEDSVAIQLETDQPGVLIGYHGETLSAIQLIVSMITYRKFGEWTRILVNVGDYRERRKEVLERMALAVAQRAKFSGQSQALPPMSPFERRIIHLALADDPELETVSEGEGKDRHVVIKPK